MDFVFLKYIEGKEDEIETLEEKIYYQYRESEVEKFRKNALYNNEFTPEMII